jgi:hypothetical protein
VQQNKAYQMHVLSDLQQLQQLDGQAVTSPGQTAAVLSADFMRAGATLWHSDTGMPGRLFAELAFNCCSSTWQITCCEPATSRSSRQVAALS